MMKKTKKLVLARETVRNLTTQALGGVAGGYGSMDGCYTQTCNGWQWLKAGTSYGGGCTE